jgi:hypothetical protein
MDQIPYVPVNATNNAKQQWNNNAVQTPKQGKASFTYKYVDGLHLIN